jgi:hypothetical protein
VAEGVVVAVGLGDTTACAPPCGVEVAETAGGRDVGVTLIVGAGCDVQALKRMSDNVRNGRKDFMGAIIAEAVRHVKRRPLVDMRSSLC